MSVGLGLGIFALASLACSIYLGYGLTRLLVPQELRSYEGLLCPLLGLGLLLLVGYYGTFSLANLRQSFVACLVLATCLNGVAVWRDRRIRLSFDWKEHAWACVGAVLFYLLAMLPLLHYGYLTPIGANWDPELYLPYTEYLVEVPRSQIGQMPVNPLRDLALLAPRLGLAAGFPVIQGSLEQLVGWDALRSFVPSLAFLGALNVLALYLLFRVVLRMGRWSGLLAAVWGGFNAQALWVIYFSFAQQSASLPFWSLALVLWVTMFRFPSWRTVVLAALAIGVVPLIFYPALVFLVPVAAGLGLYGWIRSHRRVRTVCIGLAGAALGAGFAWGSLLEYVRDFGSSYAPERILRLGLSLPSMPGWKEFLGLAPFSVEPLPEPAPLGSLEAGAIGLLSVLGLAALCWSRRRGLWLSVLVPASLLLGWLRGWLGQAVHALQELCRFGLPSSWQYRLQPYPYGFLKSATFLVPLLSGLALEGWSLVWRRSRAHWGRTGRGVLILLLLLPAGLVLYADGRLVARDWARPAIFDREHLAVEQAVRLLPRGAAVYLMGNPQMSGPLQGLYAYLLREHPLYGRLGTAYHTSDRWPSGEVPAYAFLDVADDPHPLGFFPEECIWQGGGLALYRRAEPWVSFLGFRTYAVPGSPPAAIWDPPPSTVLLSYSSSYPQLSAGRPLVLFADGERLSLTGGATGTAGQRSLLLAFAALQPARLTLLWDDGSREEVTLPAGFSSVRTRPHGMPGRLEVIPEPGREVWACWAALLAEAGPLQVTPRPEEAIVLSQVEAVGSEFTVTLRIDTAGTLSPTAVLAVFPDAYEGPPEYGAWGRLSLPARDTVRIWADLATATARAWIDGRPASFPARHSKGWPLPGDWPYYATLLLDWNEGQAVNLPVAGYHVRGGGIVDLTAVPPSLTLFWPHDPDRVGFCGGY